MKNHFHFNIKEALILGITLTVIGAIITYVIILFYNLIEAGNDSLSATINFFGNVIGGLIGGVVAYLVASYQVNKTFELHGKQSISASYSLLRLIKAELTNNKNILENFKGDLEAGKSRFVLQSVSNSNWIRCSDRLSIEVSDETINQLNSCYIKLDAYKNTQTNPSVSLADDIIYNIDIVLNKVNSDIETMLANK